MQMLVSGDDDGGGFRPVDQFDMALRDEVGGNFRADFAGAVRIFLGKADPFHCRMTRRDFAAKQTDAAATDDGQTDAFGVLFHLSPRHSGAPRSGEPGIQGRPRRPAIMFLDSGFARFTRAPE